MIVIHIGMPKAGSTTIQHFLRDNEEALRRLSIDYPMAGRENVDRQLHHGFIKNEMSGRSSSRIGAHDSMDRLIDGIATGGRDTVILSCETFFQQSQDAIARLMRMLSRATAEFRIILIIRDPIEALPSAYSQGAKYGSRTFDFDSFFSKRAGKHYRTNFEIAERWASIFGWQAMCVRLLDTATLVGGDLITDFMFSAGLEKQAEKLASLPRPPRANENPGWKTVEAIRAVFGGQSGLKKDHALLREALPRKRLERREFGLLAQEVAREFGWDKERGLYLTADQAIQLSDTFDCSLRLLNEKLSEKLPDPVRFQEREFVARRFLPDVSCIDPDELHAFYGEWGARLAIRQTDREVKNKPQPE
ncbi:MAG: hypothetical protein ABI056_05230 [Caulobacteraceae bacterium]